MNNLKLVIENKEIPITHSRFPGGESLVRLELPDYTLFNEGVVSANITLNFRDNGDLFDLMLLVDAIRREIYFPVKLSLTLPYLPYARQDRVCNRGESLSVRVVADLINSLNFDRVYVKDIHSDVGVSLLNNLIHIPQDVCAQALGFKLSTIAERVILVSPDTGAMKKTMFFAKRFKLPNVLCAEKVRNVLTGEIISTDIRHIEEPVREDIIFVILDDLVDGGRTFIELAKHIRSWHNNEMHLYATHGIFSKGLEELKEYYSNIYTHNLMNDKVKEGVIIV